MTPSDAPSGPEQIQASLNRLEECVRASSFAKEAERSALIQQLDQLKSEVANHQDDLPESLHEALQHAEGFAVKRLIHSEEPHSQDDMTEISWRDIGTSIERAMEGWEANHPRIATAFMDFTNLLSKLGI